MYLAFDIETLALDVPPDAIAAEKERLDLEFKQEAAKKRHLESFISRYKFKPEGAKPVAAAFCQITEGGDIWEVVGIQSDDPLEVAAMFVDELQKAAPAPKIVGYNILSFDLPIITKYAFELDVEVTESARIGRYGTIDLIQSPFGPRFDQKGGFKRLCDIYGVQTCGVKGEDVAQLWEQDKLDGTELVLDYCKDDARAVAELFSKYLRFYSFK